MTSPQHTGMPSRQVDWIERELAEREARRSDLRRRQPELFVDLDLVEVDPDAESPAAQLLRIEAQPGSVLVAHHDAADGTCQIDYEGALVQRHADSPPTDAERIEYALRAAGRAVTLYPTRARSVGIPRSALRVIGHCNVGERRVTWFDRRP